MDIAQYLGRGREPRPGINRKTAKEAGRHII